MIVARCINCITSMLLLWPPHYCDIIVLIIRERMKMRIIEFISEVKNGTIKIPKKYLNSVKDKLRVMIFIDENHKKGRIERKKHFKAFEIDTEGLVFDREEANRR